MGVLALLLVWVFNADAGTLAEDVLYQVRPVLHKGNVGP